ncbi:MAG: signal peptidase II [Terriglobia bacterium]
MAVSTRPTRAFYLVVAGLLLLLDQASKLLVAQSFALGETHPIIPGLFTLTHVQNRGAAFGLFANFSSPFVLVFLILFSATALGLVVLLLWRGPGSRLAGWGLGLILGGALGNLLDRLRSGTVVDFLDFHLGAHHWPTFNLADSAIVLGALALMVEILRGHRKRHSEA